MKLKIFKKWCFYRSAVGALTADIINIDNKYVIQTDAVEESEKRR